MFLDNKILGVGVKNFRNICNDSRYYVNEEKVCNTHPHNIYLQILTETGIIGFLFLLTALIYFCKYILKHLMLKFKGKYFFNDFEICILSGVAIYLWPFIPTGNAFSNWLNIAMILNLPFLIWSRKNAHTKV
jgi:O-antigen ligase